jgi:MFS family permease
MTPRGVAALGISQLVNWGVLYYAFTVLLLPLTHELGVESWIVTGAFSAALLVSALCAPGIGRLCDHGHAHAVLQAGGLGAALLLVIWTMTSGLIALYAAWMAIGVCMAATLYEPAFMLVGRAIADDRERLRVLGAVTVFGGFASAVMLPASAWLVAHLAWRQAVWVLAALLAAATLLTRHYVPGAAAASAGATAGPAGTEAPRFELLLAIFALGSFGAAALVSNLVPALGERHLPPAMAASLGGLLGVMQVPGRALMMQGAISVDVSRLLVVSLVLQGAGFVALSMSPSVALVVAGLCVFAVGSGLATLLRPHIVQAAFGVHRSGHLNGRLARAQQLARAGGPIAVASAASHTSYSAAFMTIAAALALASAAWMVAIRGQR